MLYLLAFILPPIAVLLRGKPFQALLNLFLTICFWVPGVIHAWIVINGANKDKRMREQAKLIAQENRKFNNEHAASVNTLPVNRASNNTAGPVSSIQYQPISIQPTTPNKKTLAFNVAGVTFENDKGQEIQSLLRRIAKNISKELDILAYAGYKNSEILNDIGEVSEFEDVEFGEYVSFEKDPDNEFDKNAIKVMVEFPVGKKHHIGHVPKNENVQVRKMLDTDSIKLIDAAFVGGKTKEIEYDDEKDKDVVVVKELTLGVEITLHII